jgi:transposase
MKKKDKKKGIKVNRKELIGTVDIGMRTNYGYFRTWEMEEVPSFAFENNESGYRKYYEKMREFMKAHGLDTVVVGFESTGVYGEPLIHYLGKKEVRLVQVNPMHTKRVKELDGNSPNKTDRKDPEVIADIMMLGRTLSVVVPHGAAAELRNLVHARERGLASRTVCFNQMHDLVYRVFPELIDCMKHIDSKSARYIIRHYPTPEEIVLLGVENLSGILRKVSHGRYGNAMARTLWEAAVTSVGIREGRGAILMEIGHLLDLIEQSETYIEALEHRMETALSQVPYSTYLLSMKGIGVVSAACLIGEVGDFAQYRNADELIKFAGLNLYEISSGIHKGMRRITKRGRPLMRKMLYLIAMNMVRKGGIFHEQYQEMVHRGKPRIQALIAISRKLLRVAFALVRNQKEYTASTLRKAA